MTEQSLRLFVSSPADVPDERRRVDLVVERLNTEFEGRVRIETIRWETSYYSAHETFQKQIPEAADCDVVVAVFRARLGTPLPAEFPRLPSGEPYPSGTAYEVLSAIEVRKAGKDVPDVYVFRYPKAPSVALDATDRADIEAQWERLKGFFDNWFRNQRGEFIAAFQSYSSADDFANKVEDCLRKWLARRGFLPQGPVWDRMLRGSPFPGLRAFDADRGSVFFGRDLAIAQAIERLREAGAGGRRVPFLLVIGASGSGKSSLLRAGLLPRLTSPGTIPEIDLWRTAIVTLGSDPFLSLAEGLFADAALGSELRQGTFRTKELLAKQLCGDLETALAPLRDALDKAANARRTEEQFDVVRPARLALAVDQAERLFVEAEAKTAIAIVQLLAALVRQNRVYLVFALRSDAYARFQSIEALVGLREAGATFDLVPPSAMELEEIVTQPVAACHPRLAFEQKDGRSLAALLVADAKGGDALPLLQMTLSRLYAAEAARGDGMLRFADYRGMDAAVTETANEALDTLDEQARAELPALVAGLVTDVSADPLTGAPVPVVAALDRQTFEAQNAARQALVEAFVSKRLLTAEGDGVFERVRPVHEALLRIWPQAVAIVGETALLFRVRHTLEPMVREWLAASPSAKPGHLEISPALLDGAQQLLAQLGSDLPPAMRDFITQAAAVDASRRDRERQEQERRIRDAQALAAANRRITRRTLVGLSAALLLAVLAGWQWRHAEAQRVAAEYAEQDAKTQRDRAQHSLTLATGTANGLVFDLAQKFRDVIGVPAATIKDILDQARKLQEQLLGSGESSPDLRRSQAAALAETASTLLTLGETQSALTAAKQAQDISQALLEQQPYSTNFQRDLSVAYNMIGDVLVAQGNLPEALKSYRDSLAIAERLAKTDAGNAGWQRGLSVCYERIGNVLVAQGNLLEALKSYRDSLAIRDHLAKSDTGNAGWQSDLSMSYNKIGNVLVAQGNLPEALERYRDGHDIADRLAKSDPGNAGWQFNLGISNERIGDVFMAQGNLAEALKSYQAKQDIISRLTKSDTGNAGWQRDLSVSYDKIGEVLVAQGNLPAALKSYRDSLAIRDRLAKGDAGNAGWQRDLSLSYEKIGDVLVAQGNLPEGLKSYRDSLAIADRLAKVDAGNADWLRDLSVTYDKIGDVLVEQGNLPEALTRYRDSLAIADRLAKADTANAGWQGDLWVSYNKIGDVLVAQGNLPEALKRYRDGHDIADRLAKSDTGNAGWQRDLSVSYNKIGNVLVAQGDLPEALKSHRDSLAIINRLAKSDTGNAGWQRDLSVSYNKIGDVLVAQDNLPEALKSYRDSLAIRDHLAKADAGNARWQRDLSVSYNRIGDVLAAQGNLPEALKSYRDSLAIADRLAKSDAVNAGWQRDLSLAYASLARVFRQSGDKAGAFDALRQGREIMLRMTALSRDNAIWINDLAWFDEQMATLQR